MSEPGRQDVSDVVAQFFERRSRGERISIDDVMETIDPSKRPTMRTEVLRSIAHQSRARLSSADTIDTASDSGSEPLSWDELPELDEYDIIDVIGRGGMGMVFEAYQRSTGRRVAVKFMLGTAAASESGRRRFEREVELVARLQHPNIVSILDSGVHRRRWYYVMEYVDGKPLDDALEPGQCDVRDALELVARICDAVEYAHQRGVLHRDIKPSNVILDNRGEPQLLDFGLAKAIDPVSRSGPQMTLSEPGQIIGTLAYMPPEQSQGRYDQLSLRTDVYSLGALAYELVTGRLPCPVDGTLSEALRRIETIDPTPPSSIRSRVSKDVDAILLKALEKSPESRYATAGELAADIRRYLNDESILARRAGLHTRCARWVRRNKMAASVGGGALAIITVIVVIAFVRVLQERNIALDRSDLSEQTSAYLSETMQLLNPDERYFTQTMTTRDLNDAHARRLESDPPARPEVAASVHSYVGHNYLQLRAFDEAEHHHRQALSILRAVHQRDHPDLAESMHSLAAALWWKGNYAAAEPLYRQALEMRKRLFPAESLEVADTTNHLAACLDRLGQDQEAEAHYREALRLRRQLLTDDPASQEPVAASLNNLGTFLLHRANPEEAEPLFRESLELIRRLRGDDDRRVAAVLTNLAQCLMDQRNLEDAAPLLDDALEIYRKRLGDDNTSIAIVRYEQARLSFARGSIDEARRHARIALDIRRRHLPDDHADIAGSLYQLGRIELSAGNAQTASDTLREALRRRESAQSANPLRIAESRAALAAALSKLDQRDEARPMLEESIQMFEDALRTPTRRSITVARWIVQLLRDHGLDLEADALADIATDAERRLRSSQQRPQASPDRTLRSLI